MSAGGPPERPVFSYSGTWVVSDKVAGSTPTVSNQVAAGGGTVR